MISNFAFLSKLLEGSVLFLQFHILVTFSQGTGVLEYLEKIASLEITDPLEILSCHSFSGEQYFVLLEEAGKSSHGPLALFHFTYFSTRMCIFQHYRPVFHCESYPTTLGTILSHFGSYQHRDWINTLTHPTQVHQPQVFEECLT